MDKLRISRNSDMLKSSQDIEQSTFNYEQAEETSIAREQQGDPNAKNQEQPDVSAEKFETLYDIIKEEKSRK